MADAGNRSMVGKAGRHKRLTVTARRRLPETAAADAPEVKLMELLLFNIVNN